MKRDGGCLASTAAHDHPSLTMTRSPTGPARARPGRARSPLIVLFGVALAVAIAVRGRRPLEPGAGTQPVVESPPAEDTVPGLPSLARKPKPVSPGFQGCPAEGDGGDPRLNTLKNRVDSARWLPATFDAVVSLPWPGAVPHRRFRRDWSAADERAVSRFEGLPLAVEGYLVGAKQEGPESTNCHGADAAFRDWHLWLGADPGRDRTRSIVVETTPAVRAMHPNWSLTTVRRLVRDSTPVRVSGWLMLDPEHPDQIGKTRGTLWEIHPIMRIEAKVDSQWVNIEDLPVRRATRPRRDSL